MAFGGWSRGRVLGRGSTATVSLASADGSTDLFAVKSAELAHSSFLRREQRILSSLDCKHVVSYLGHDVSADTYNLFLEYAPTGSLSDEIVKHGGGLGEPAIRSRTREILTGLAYLHSRSIVHCDIKSQNILIGSDGRAMVADLGCAKFLDEDGTTIGGTPMFMAPEVARGESQGSAADVWAVGCVAIEMATGRAPWPDASDSIAVLHRIAFSEAVPESPEWMSDEGKDFLSRCLRRDAGERWSADQLLQHPFLANCGNSDSEHKWTSPKSILDQSIWECLDEEEADDDDEDEEEDTYAAPIRAIAELVGSGPNWTWDEQWLTVRIEEDDNNEEPGPEDHTATMTIGATVTSSSEEYDVSDTDLLRSGYGTEDRFGVGSTSIESVLEDSSLLDYRVDLLDCDFVKRDQFNNDQYNNENLLLSTVLLLMQLLGLISTKYPPISCRVNINFYFIFQDVLSYTTLTIKYHLLYNFFSSYNIN